MVATRCGGGECAGTRREARRVRVAIADDECSDCDGKELDEGPRTTLEGSVGFASGADSVYSSPGFLGRDK